MTTDPDEAAAMRAQFRHYIPDPPPMDEATMRRVWSRVATGVSGLTTLLFTVDELQILGDLCDAECRRREAAGLTGPDEVWLRANSLRTAMREAQYGAERSD